jgi:hypothetical protein
MGNPDFGNEERAKTIGTRNTKLDLLFLEQGEQDDGGTTDDEEEDECGGSGGV